MAGAQILLTILYVTRLGGDYMFARFYIPVTPLIYLLCEDALRQWGRARILVPAAITVAALTLVARVPRDRIFVEQTHVRSMTDEYNCYPASVVTARRRMGETVGRCLAGTGARVRLPSGGNIIAYYGRLDYASELNGLTDRDIARLPLRERKRPGHEKLPTHDLLVRKGIQFQLLHGQSLRLAPEMQIHFEDVAAQIIYWDDDLMRRLASNPNIRFVHFPTFLDQYIENYNREPRPRAIEEFTGFQRFYFSCNDDADRRHRLRQALISGGIAAGALDEIERNAARGLSRAEHTR